MILLCCPYTQPLQKKKNTYIYLIISQVTNPLQFCKCLLNKYFAKDKGEENQESGDPSISRHCCRNFMMLIINIFLALLM